MKKKIYTSLGLMSGTSMDGVDLSVIKSDGYDEFSSILNTYREFDNDLYKQLIDLRDKISNSEDLKIYSDDLKNLEKKFTLFNAKIINNVMQDVDEEIDLVGFHGQTIFHNSKIKVSKQLGDGKLLSSLIKKIVVNNFRQNDLDHDGQGAPLTPIFHYLISKILKNKFKIDYPLSVVNIGGITNATQIKDALNNLNQNFFAYDIAPGNCLIDEWVRMHVNTRYDKNGNYARSGKVDNLILNQAIDNFELKSFNNSLDVKDFDLSFAKGLSFENGCATLTKFTAFLISNGLEKISKKNNISLKNIILCGGGRKNSFLIRSIKEFLDNSDIRIKDIDNYNFDGNFIESQAFAFLAIRAYLNLPITFPNTTRCKESVSGGQIQKNF
tara:strand:+ start:29 stop:1177 length:1149 start_codon:yes stop_codon:yes gene_type:complete